MDLDPRNNQRMLACASTPPPVHLAPMTNGQNQHEQFGVTDLIEHAVVTHAQPIDSLDTGQQLHACGPRLFLKRQESRVESGSDVRWEREKCPLSRRREDQPIAGHLCQAGLAPDLLVGHATTLATRLPGGLRVVLVFEDFQSSEVVERDERRDGFAVPFEYNPLASIGHPVEGVAKGIAHGCSSQSGHWCNLPVSYVLCNPPVPTVGVNVFGCPPSCAPRRLTR